MAAPPAPARLLPAARPSPRDPALWFILATLAAISTLHYLTDIRLIPYHSIYRSLYYLPIAVAAVRYGRCHDVKRCRRRCARAWSASLSWSAGDEGVESMDVPYCGLRW